MKIHRIYALLLRYWYIMLRSFNRLSDMFYWPTIDLVLWGLTSKYIQENSINLPGIVMIIISGLLFWIIVWRGQCEISINFLEELWDKNLVNLFVSPLKFGEWLISLFIMGVIKMIISLSFASLLAFFLYKVNILNYGWYIIPFGASLLIMGWSVGLFISGVIIRFGTKYDTLAWTTVMIVAPFSAIYYPLSSLPGWAQIIARFIPASYIFENGRNLIYYGQVNYYDIAISFVLNFIYLILSLIFIYSSFEKAKEKGLIGLF